MSFNTFWIVFFHAQKAPLFPKPKGWYDHTFISNWLTNGATYIKYIPHCYQSAGDDGNRLGVSINREVPSVNTSAPADLLNAYSIFQVHTL